MFSLDPSLGHATLQHNLRCANETNRLSLPTRVNFFRAKLATDGTFSQRFKGRRGDRVSTRAACSATVRISSNRRSANSENGTRRRPRLKPMVFH